MNGIFDDDSNSEVEITTNNQYAQNYNVWRKKEELNKLRTKYGEDVNLDENSSSSSSDDEEGIELTEDIERDFFKTLACLKNKDPRIYNENVKFFQDKSELTKVAGNKKKKKDVPVYLKDYERNIILEKGGVLSDEEDFPQNKTRLPTYVEEQKHIKESLKSALSAVEDGEASDSEWGGLFKERKKTKEEEDKEEADYKKWLAGEKEKIDKDVEVELQPLRDYWNNPKLDEGEKFLRDYILNKKFLEKVNYDYLPTYDEIIHDSDQDLSNDESTVEKQEEFEHKYNFRFEEPDQEFIKRYPRTLENSARKEDDRRKIKRQETKERKKKEKEEKIKEIKKLQELKRKEIEEKLEKLKEITGNSDIAFQDEDIDGDFDPDAHDKRMQAIFNNDYYGGNEEEQKPVFPEIDEELEIECWDRFEVEDGDDTQDSPHCEDENFNMDCDYDPNVSIQQELIERTKNKKKRKRKSKVAEALSNPKPKFDPTDKNYEKYFDEYYKLDCEDIIEDIPCRFKYRNVAPNDFGLSIEEILFAKERELNKWCSLKKAVQIRPDHIEKYDQIAYKKKAQNLNLKKKIFSSLFTPDPEETEIKGNIQENKPSNKEKCDTKDDDINCSPLLGEGIPSSSKNILIKNGNEKKNFKRVISKDRFVNKTNSTNNQENDLVEEDKSYKIVDKNIEDISNINKKQHRQRKTSINANQSSENPRKKIKNGKKTKNNEIAISDARLSAYGINPKKFKNKLKYSNK